jgi:hypothetical protein
MELLREAGFSDGEIGDWATTERQRMRQAGFTDDEIDDEFGVVRPPKEVPTAFIERLKQGLGRVAGAAEEHAEYSFGDEPLGFSPRNREFLSKLGALGDIIVPVAKPIDAVLRSVPAGIAGLGAGLGQMVEEGHDAVLGPSRYGKGKAAHDFAQLAQIAALLSGASGPKTGAVRAPAPARTNGLVIAPPRAQDFRNAATTISGTPASFRTEQKLLRLWTDHGIPPAEVAEDAQRDRTIGEVIRSDSEKLPEKYVGTNGPATATSAEPNVPVQPAESAPADRATVPEESKAGPVEAGDRSSADLNTSEQARIIAEARARMLKPPPEPPRPFKEDYPGYPVIDTQRKLLFDIEGRPLDARFVAGRRVSGEADVPLSPEEMKGAIRKAGIRLMDIPPDHPELRTLTPEGMRAIYLGEGQESGPPIAGIYLNTGPKAADRDLVIAHEFGHAIDHFTGMLVSASLTPDEIAELRAVYGALQSRQEKSGPKLQPEHFSYRDEDINRELAAEGLRAYMTDPNYFKTVAPKAAAKIRDLVNENPYLKGAIQFNSLLAAGLIGAGARSQDRNDQ